MVDASLLIGHLEPEDPFHLRAVAELDRVAADELGASTMTFAEVLVSPARRGMVDQVRAAIDRIGVTEIEFGPDAAAELAKIRAETGLKLPDCCVLLAADSVGATEVLSFDEPLDTAARRRLAES